MITYDSNLKEVMARLQANLKVLPPELANECKNIALHNMAREGNQVDTGSLDKWPARKRGQARNEGRKLLVDTGALRRGFRPIYGRTWFGVANDLPYANAQNQGVHQQVVVKAHRRRTRSGQTADVPSHSREMNLTARTFIQNNEYLKKRLLRLVLRRLGYVQ